MILEGHEILLRAADARDLPFLIRLRELTMRKHVESSGGVYEDDFELQSVWNGFSYAQIISHKGQDIGLLKIDRSTNPWYFSQLQLLPEFQNKGLGGSFLRQVVEEAGRANVGVKLTVLKANPAKRLYERVGFRVVDEVNQVTTEGNRYSMHWP